MLQRLGAKTLPVPLPSQKMSGSLPLMTFAFTTFPLGVDPPNGVESTTATPPWNPTWLTFRGLRFEVPVFWGLQGSAGAGFAH